MLIVPAKSVAPSFSPTGARGVALAAAFAGLLAVASAFAAGSAVPPADESILATIGPQAISQADVMAQAKDAFDTQQQQYDRSFSILHANFEQARHNLLQQQLDKLLDRRALELEAKARDVSTNALLSGIKVPAVTDEAVRAFYEANRARSALSYEQLAPRIRTYLASQNNDAATRSFYSRLRTKYAIRSQLQPYRTMVAATGPVRGKANAPVTIVEFGDFQCPYCKEAESTLHLILAKYPEKTRLVFRQMPISELHPNAMVAAQASVCANRQGKFWAMHDAMYADQSHLDRAGLQAMAKGIGLDPDRLAACMSDSATAQQIQTDVRAATYLGVGGTPYFFINGRPLNGSVPPEQFESVISDELTRLNMPVAAGAHRAAPAG